MVIWYDSHLSSSQAGTTIMKLSGFFDVAAASSRPTMCFTLAVITSFTKGGLDSKLPVDGRNLKKLPTLPEWWSVS